MNTRVDNNTKNIKEVSPWYGTAVSIAIIGGAFFLIIVALIVINYFRTSIVLPKWEERLDVLKEEIRSKPDDKQLLLQIRKFDLQIRRYRIRRLDFSHKGSYLLFGSALLLLIGVKWASIFKKKMPAPKLSTDSPDKNIYQAMWARWAVTAGLLVLGSGALILSVMPMIDLGESVLPHHDLIGGLKPTLHPSIEQIKENWPYFRGPGGLGIVPIGRDTNIPTKWNGTTGEGIIWKSKLPLPGHNSPVIWDDRIFLSGANENKRQVFCFDALSGTLLWQGDVPHTLQVGAEPIEVMEDTGLAAPTVVTNDRRICAIFATGDVGCFDFTGKRIWAKSLGIPDSAYGYASSLAMYRNLLFIQYDQASAEEGKSKLLALDVFSGNTVWETKRPVSGSWASPIVIEIDNRHQIITCGNPWVIAYEPTNGTELWRVDCLGGDVAPSPIYSGGLIFAIEPYTKLVAIRSDGQGDVTKTHIAWVNEDLGPDICSPVSNGEYIFLLATEGTLACVEVTDGTKLWEEDLEDIFMASPSLVGDYLYVLSEEGVMFIIEAGPEYREIAKCELGERCYASPAFMNGRVYIRGLENLYCIGNSD